MDKLTVYGFGNRGRDVIDQLLAQGLSVSMVFDRRPSQSTYRGIAVRALSDPAAQACAKGSHCVIGLHNSYVDIHEVNSLLKALGAVPVSLVSAGQFGLHLEVSQGFWLNQASASFQISEEDGRWMLEHLADDKSRQVFKSLRAYRKTGDIDDCPVPSTTDEYVPRDLPRYPEPLRLIDCGAFTGVAYRKFEEQYRIIEYVAFEPDLENFARLKSHTFNSEDVTLLPLGVWHETALIRFAAGQKMGSALDANGDSFAQCVAVDDVLPRSRANLVKFDVEGAESSALIGMRRLIERQRPSLCVSVYHRPEDLVAIPRQIESWKLGYRLYLRSHEHNGFGTVVYAIQPSPGLPTNTYS